MQLTYNGVQDSFINAIDDVDDFDTASEIDNTFDSVLPNLYESVDNDILSAKDKLKILKKRIHKLEKKIPNFKNTDHEIINRDGDSEKVQQVNNDDPGMESISKYKNTKVNAPSQQDEDQDVNMIGQGQQGQNPNPNPNMMTGQQGQYPINPNQQGQDEDQDVNMIGQGQQGQYPINPNQQGQDEDQDVNMMGQGQDPNMMGGQYQDPNMMGGQNFMPPTGAPQSSEEVGRIYELKKIYSRLVSVESYLSSLFSSKLLKVRDLVVQTISLFETVISNFSLYKSKIDDIIIDFYEFIEKVYLSVANYYKKTSDYKKGEK